MTSPGIDPRLVSALVTDVTALRGQLDRVSRGLAALQNTLAAGGAVPGVPLSPPVAQQPPITQQPVAHQPVAQQQPVYQQQPVRPSPPSPQLPSAQPPSPQPPLITPRPPAPPSEPEQPWWQRDGVVSKVLAIAGGVVTLIGVGMLVGLAIQAGWFGPQARVAAGGLLSVALVGIADRLIRRPGGRAAALAVGSTGIAGLTVTVMAAGEIGYRWLPAVPAALALALAAALGLAAAHRWSSQAAAAVTTAAVGILTWPTVGDHPVVGASVLLVLQVAVLVVQYPRIWPVAHLFAGLLPLVAYTPAMLGPSEKSLAIMMSVVALVVATVGAAATVQRIGESPRRGLNTVAGIAVAVPVFPLMGAFSIGNSSLRVGDLIILLLIAILTGAAALPLRRTPLPGVVRVGLGVVAACCALRLAFAAQDPFSTEVVLMAIAVVLLAVSVVTRSLAGWATGWLFGVCGLIAAVDRYADGLFDERLRHGLDVAAILFGVVTVVAAGLGIVAGRRMRNVGGAADVMIASQVLVGLLGVTLTSVATGTLVNPEPSGWVAGQCAATVAWMVVAVASLQRGLLDRDNPRIWLASGLSLAAMATAKLFLFDLASLGGVPRALAFLLVGVLLLVAGTRYARSFAERREENDAAAAQPGPVQPGSPRQ